MSSSTVHGIIGPLNRLPLDCAHGDRGQGPQGREGERRKEKTRGKGMEGREGEGEAQLLEERHADGNHLLVGTNRRGKERWAQEMSRFGCQVSGNELRIQHALIQQWCCPQGPLRHHPLPLLCHSVPLPPSLPPLTAPWPPSSSSSSSLTPNPPPIGLLLSASLALPMWLSLAALSSPGSSKRP